MRALIVFLLLMVSLLFSYLIVSAEEEPERFVLIYKDAAGGEIRVPERVANQFKVTTTYEIKDGQKEHKKTLKDEGIFVE